ncbi:lytic transglycosylase domain-containing protein [Bartonella choladocola]|uniref:Transglycosylase SLT domain-containing protein n=1 Tax=Bartonella choladocola TaxID=2750995 RepID=A0A1U9MJD1_9HYPH|nr:lytic transglycosylase domain-containing protein [Bartonella choladocola]AQT48014.1 Transglycosylase SLT domain-containing protein [Bartonella choladocola]
MRYLLFISVYALSYGIASAQIATTDRQVENDVRQQGQHWLESVEIKRGQSDSTRGVACGWGMNPEQALAERPDVAAKIANTCKSVGVDPALGLSIAFQESRFNQNCVAPQTPHSGGQRAEGVMQVLPSTGQRLFSKNNLGNYNGKNEDQNILAGCLYLKEGSEITGNSLYHIAGGYHSGYDHKVWREQQRIPGRWPKTLDYANKISTRWYPVFDNAMGGYQGGRAGMDQLRADTFASGQNGIDTIQNNVAVSNQRIQELAFAAGTTETDIASWDRNTQARQILGQSINGFNEALALLLQYKNTELQNGLIDQSETSSISSFRKKPKLPEGQKKMVYDQVAQKWRVLGEDDVWRYLEADGTLGATIN